jgi:hypothetical protein
MRQHFNDSLPGLARWSRNVLTCAHSQVPRAARASLTCLLLNAIGYDRMVYFLINDWGRET